MSAEYTGGCFCGGVRFSCTAEPAFTFYCHCSDCQRVGGSPFAVGLMVPTDAFSIRGDLQTYTTTGSSGEKVHRRFCPQCGSGIYLETGAVPGHVFVKAGALDDAAWVKPQMHIFTRSKQPWLGLSDLLPQFETMPPQ